MAKFAIPFLLLSLFVSLVQADIVLPSGQFSVSNVDSSDKNSGMADSDNEGAGYIRYAPIAPNKGLHLSQAADSIRAVNSSAADAVQSLAAQAASNLGAFAGQVPESMAKYLTYWGGNMFTKPNNLNVYLLWYGKWTPRQKYIIRQFINSMDRRRNNYTSYPTVVGWWAINSRYYADKLSRPTTQFVRVAQEIDVGYSLFPYGTPQRPINHAQIRGLLNRAMNSRRRVRFPVDRYGVYFVLTSADVRVVDFCTGLCAYHTSAPFYGVKIPYAFIGNPATQCATFCSYKYYNMMFVPPNGDLGADAIVDKLGHELSEMATNPLHGPNDTPGWLVAGSRIENADVCEWLYGVPNYEPNGVVWNVRGLNGMKFLVQLNLNRRLRKCVLQANDNVM